MILPKGSVLTILTFPQKTLSAGLRASAPSGRAACVHNNPGLRASAPFRACGEKLAKLELQRNPQSFIYAKKIRDNTLLTIK